MANLSRRPFWDLRRGIDDLFDDFLSAGLFPSQSLSQSLGDFRPNLELGETESEYEVSVELPGLKPEAVEITVDQGILTVRGEKRQQERKDRVGVEYSERSYGSFMRTVQLPRSVAADEISANFESGVLTITIPKPEQAKPRRIPLAGSRGQVETSGTTVQESEKSEEGSEPAEKPH